MSRQVEKAPISSRKAASASRRNQQKKKEPELRNMKTFVRLKGMEKEKHKLRNSTKGDRNCTTQGTNFDVRGLNAAKCFDRKLKRSASQHEDGDTGSEFQMVKLHDEASDEDTFSMFSMNSSRPSSCVTADLHQERKPTSRDDDEFESLDNVGPRESAQIKSTTDETVQNELTPSSVSDDNGSPRLQITELEEQNREVDLDELTKGNLESTNLSTQERVELETESEYERNTKSVQVKTAWELNDKFLLTTDHPAEVWDDEKTNKKSLSRRRRSSDLLSASFPPLSALPESRRGSFPISPSNYWFSTSKTPPELPSLSGRQCKVQLPSSFPGILSPPSASESDSSDDELDNVFWAKEQMAKKSGRKLPSNHLEVLPSKQAQKLKVSSSRESPSSSGSRSPVASSEHLAMRVASAEYLAARVVTQLNCAFKETVGESEEEVTTRANCVTPNLMPRRHSALFFRSNTSSGLDEKVSSLILPSVHNECSRSLPNLSNNDKTKRMFVTFDKDSPHVKVVDLKGKSDLAHKCRVINRRLTNEDSVVKAMLKEKVHKKSMIKKWVISSAQGI